MLPLARPCVYQTTTRCTPSPSLSFSFARCALMLVNTTTPDSGVSEPRWPRSNTRRRRQKHHTRAPLARLLSCSTLAIRNLHCLHWLTTVEQLQRERESREHALASLLSAAASCHEMHDAVSRLTRHAQCTHTHINTLLEFSCHVPQPTFIHTHFRKLATKLIIVGTLNLRSKSR